MIYLIDSVNVGKYKDEDVITLGLKKENELKYRSFIFSKPIMFEVGEQIKILFRMQVVPIRVEINLNNHWYQVYLKVFQNHIEYYKSLHKNHTKNIIP